MQCENCHAELLADSISCPECGAPAPQNVEGFENTKEIQLIMKKMINEYGTAVLTNTGKMVAFVNDYLPEYDKERRLLNNMLNAGVLKNMLDENDQNIAVMRAKSYMLSECFVSENAAEFVILCFTYMLGWVYEPTLKVNEPEETEEEEDKPQKRKITALDIEMNVFLPTSAAKYRLAGNINIPEGITKIDNFCFNGFGFMKTIKLPQSLLSIGDYAFSGCKRLKGVDLPETLKIIEQGAFSQCSKLVVIKIPNGILEIADHTFEFCESLEVVELPPTVSSIGSQAFSCCDKLRKLFLPESVKFIDENAFQNCPDLTIHCYENSYVHKYCISHRIKCETVETGVALREKKHDF